MNIRICISIPPKTVTEALALIERAENQRADFIEVRLDGLKKHDKLADISHCSNTPLIATNKSTKNYGKLLGCENKRQKTLICAAKTGFEYVDLDLSTLNLTELVANLHEIGAKSIVSFHDFNWTPALSQLKKILDQEIAVAADVCKIVTTARRIKDNLRILDFVSKASKKAIIVCFAMGELGKPSRLLSPLFGAFFTFASIDEKRMTAKGQLTIREMKRAYEALGLVKK